MTFWQLITADFAAILKDRAIAITLFGGIVFYSILYPLPYLNQVVTEAPIVVIDHDHSSLSREIIRHADVSSKLKVIAHLSSVEQAKKMIEAGKAKGYLLLPNGLRKNLILGKEVNLSYGGDANYFLVYSAIAEGLTSVGMDTAKHLQLIGLMAKGTLPAKAHSAVNSININSIPVFNPNLGYLGYIVPAVFLLVLHQTLIIGSGILGAGQWQQKGYWNSVSPFMFVCSRITAFSSLYLIFSSFYFGWCFYWYDIKILSSFSQFVTLLVPFILATSAAGVAFSTLFNRRELPTQVILLISMPILFVSGFVWPTELIPAPLVWCSQIIPAVPTIMAMLKLNHLGADWTSISNQWFQLWGLFTIYFVFAYLRIAKKGRMQHFCTSK